jgi:nucleoside-triphosphatase THEP1
MKLAAIRYDGANGALVDEVLAEAVRVLKGDGVTVAGAIQWNTPVPDRRRCSMTLEDLASGRRILASEDRGPHARGCHLNASALEEAAVLAASSIDASVDLVIINRFGKQEAEGRGFRQAIEAAILLERPVLAGVSENNRASWEAFTGNEAESLPCSLEAVLSWCRSAIPAAEDRVQPIPGCPAKAGHGTLRDDRERFA